MKRLRRSISYAGLFDSPVNAESYVLEIEDPEITDLKFSENLVTFTIILRDP